MNRSSLRGIDRYVYWLDEPLRNDYLAVEIEGKTQVERAEERGVSQATILQNVNKATERLRKIAEKRGESDTCADGTDPFLQWLNERIEDSQESYQRDTSDRHTSISLGKVRAYKHARKEYLDSSVATDPNEQTQGEDDE